MKVTNWKSKVASALLAAGIALPSAHAVNIPLGDPSFEAFSVLGFGGVGSQYAYANQYRPTSAWVDDQDHNASPYIQDDSKSNWLYSAGYAELATKRAAPRTGVQAMHGFFKYSTQETAAVFEAGKTYTFSIYSQGDFNATGVGTNSSSRVFLYIFNGNLPFSEANALASDRYSVIDNNNPGPADFVNRDPSWTAAQSQAGWTKISLSYTAPLSGPVLGAPVGVGFWAADDACLDDASLTATPEPATAILAGAGATGLAVRRRRK